jgi:hypothetical protein
MQAIQTPSLRSALDIFRLLWPQRQPDVDAFPRAAKDAFAVEAKLRATGRPVPSRYY